MKRKSPIRHRVKQHTRQGHRVQGYMRGHGTQSRRPFTKRRLKGEGTTRKTMEDYTITFYYSKGRKETIPMAARDSDDALNLALHRRKKKHLKPIKIVIKDGIGRILGSVVGKVAGGIQSAVQAFRAERAKGIPEREALSQIREMKEAERAKIREDFAKKQLTRAKTGDRSAQIWCESHHIAWQAV